jgi:hypothetical protein
MISRDVVYSGTNSSLGRDPAFETVIAAWAILEPAGSGEWERRVPIPGQSGPPGRFALPTREPFYSKTSLS